MIFFVSILFILAGGTIGEIIGGLAILMPVPLFIIGILVTSWYGDPPCRIGLTQKET